MGKKALKFMTSAVVLLLASIGLYALLQTNVIKSTAYQILKSILDDPGPSNIGRSHLSKGVYERDKWRNRILGKLKLTPKVAGHWVVSQSDGSDVDSNNLELVLLSSKPQDQINIRNGNYTIGKVALSWPLTITGDTAVKILIDSPLVILTGPANSSISFSKLNFNANDLKTFEGPLINFQSGELVLNDVIFEKSNALVNIYQTNESQLQFLQSAMQCDSRTVGIEMHLKAKTKITSSQFKNCRNAVYGHINDYNGILDVSNSHFENSGANAFMLYGGQTQIQTCKINKGLSGIVARRQAEIVIDSSEISFTEQYGLDVSEDAVVTFSKGLIENVGEQAVRVVKSKGRLKIVNSTIAASPIGIFAKNSGEVAIAGSEILENTEAALKLEDSSVHCLASVIEKNTLAVVQDKQSQFARNDCTLRDNGK